MVDGSWELGREVYLAEMEVVRLRQGNGTSLCGSRVVINTKCGDVFLKAPSWATQKITSLWAWKGEIQNFSTMKGRSENIILFFSEQAKITGVFYTHYI